MIDIYTEHHPHQHPVIPIEHLKMVGAQYYTSLLSKLTSHINNDDVHVTNKDKVEWEKAFLDIKDLKDKVDNLEPSSSSKDDNNYATKDYVNDKLDNYATISLLNNYVSFDNLNSRNYATEAWVLKQIKDIVPGIDLDGYVTDKELAEATADLATKKSVELTKDLMEAHLTDEIEAINFKYRNVDLDGYKLPVATNTVLGGFKAGYQSSGNNYAVKMDGEYAYVSIPFSTTGGDDIEVTETYNIIVTDNTLKMVPIYEGSSQMHISGYVSWKIFKLIGSSTSYVIPGSEGIASYAELLPVNERLSLTIDTNRGIYTGSTTSHTSSVDYVKIVVEINGNIVATLVIAVQVPGKDGQAVIQTIPDAMIRMRGEYGSDMEYSNGDYADENGYRWIDIVSYNGVYYRALKNGQLDPPTDTNGNLNSSEWSRYSVFGDAAFNSIISKYISAQSITAEQIVILEDYDTDNPIPVAGIVGKNKYTYNGVDYSIVRTTGPGDVDNPVVIFAGTTSNDLTKAPFRVYKDGSLVANNAQIKGYINATDGVFSGKVIINNTSIVLNTDGSGQVANGNIWWDANGNITINGATIINSKIVADPDKKDYQDVSDTINVTFASTPTYNKSNGVVSNIRLRVVNDTQFQGQVKIQVGFDGVHGDWSAQSETEWFQVAERTTKVIDVPDAIANGNISADMDSNSPVVTSVIGVEDSNV